MSITAFVKSNGNIETGRVVNKFYNVELCTCAYAYYLIITAGTIGSMKQEVKVEGYSNMVYLREHYKMWKANFILFFSSSSSLLISCSSSFSSSSSLSSFVFFLFLMQISLHLN